MCICLSPGICASTASEDGVHVQPSEAGTSGYKPVNSFASYKRIEGKQWKSRVSKTGQEEKKKAQDIVINVGLMEWNKKEQVLKAKRGKNVAFTSVSNCELQCSS